MDQTQPIDACGFFLLLACAAGLCFVAGWALGFRSGKNDGYKEGYARGCEDFCGEPDRLEDDDEEEEEDEEEAWKH